MNNTIKIILGAVVGAIIMFWIMKKDVEIVEVPVTIEVPVPVMEKDFDTIYLPQEIVRVPGKVEIDSTYYEEYLKLKDSVAKDNAFKDAITIREYKPFVEDDTIRIDVYSKVRGTLLESQISYKTKPFNVKLDTILKVPIPTQTKFYYGGEVYMPKNTIDYKPSLKPGLLMLNKKESKVYKVSYDFINQSFEAGVFFKF